MAKGTPTSGGRFTERSPNGVMGRSYDFTASPKTVADVVAAAQILFPILARRRGRR